MTELLAPCGNKESFFAAINAGADAVYLGLDLFSARKNAENFSRENLKYYLDYAHALGVKVHVALNTLVKDRELDEFFSYAAFCNAAGVDAIIVQELFLGKVLHERFPDLPLHLSTQAGVNNVYGASLAKKFGFSRVVVSRETPIEEIKKISQIIETECFIQGALCTAFSGQCYLSGFAGNMSGNRGLCKQPCRKRYTIIDKDKTYDGYLISLSDLSVGKDIAFLSEAGAVSFKIEGRMRKPAYVAAAVGYYRSILDGKSASISPLKRTFNRGDYTKGLAFGQDGTLISDLVQSHKGELIGKVKKITRDEFLLTGDVSLSAGDGGKIIRDGKETASFTCDKNLRLRFSGSVEAGDLVYLTTDTALERSLLCAKRTIPVKVNAELFVGKTAKIAAFSSGKEVFIESGSPLSAAKTAPISEDDIKKCFLKTDDLPFSPEISVKTDGVFLSKSELNELRRTLYKKLFDALSFCLTRRQKQSEPILRKKTAKGTLVLDDEFAFDITVPFEHAVLCPSDYGDNGVIERFFKNVESVGCKKYLYIPNKFSSSDEAAVASIIPLFDGLYVDGYFGIELAEKYGKELILGTGANVYNGIDVDLASNCADGVCLSKELSLSEKKELDGFYLTAGSIKVMDLLYCPFKKTCASCERGNLFKMTDGEHEFILRRVKLNGCRFEIYNGLPLATANATDPIVDLVTLPKDKKSAVLKALCDKEKLISVFKKHTSGHENKPLI